MAKKPDAVTTGVQAVKGGKKNRANYNMYATDMMVDGKKPLPYQQWMNDDGTKKLSDVVTGD